MIHEQENINVESSDEVSGNIELSEYYKCETLHRKHQLSYLQCSLLKKNKHPFD